MGCITRRPCLCDETSALARAFCPAHQLWPRLTTGVEVHGRLFPPLTPRKFSSALKAGMAAAGYPEGGEYSPRCLRMGAAQELQMAEQSKEAIQGAGCWGGGGGGGGGGGHGFSAVYRYPDGGRTKDIPSSDTDRRLRQ